MHPMAPTCSCTARMPSNFFHLKNMNFRFLVETMRTPDGVPHKDGVGTLWPNLNRLSQLVPCGKGDFTFTVKPGTL